MKQGDVMKLKRWHLYLIVTLCFVMAFVAINRKYDRFYRVNGINNDNRALIEMYLDDDEQEYLVENAIPVDLLNILNIQNLNWSIMSSIMLWIERKNILIIMN